MLYIIDPFIILYILTSFIILIILLSLIILIILIITDHINYPYLKAAKEDEIDSFRDKELGVDHLGVPHFVASGSLTFNEKRFREAIR